MRIKSVVAVSSLLLGIPLVLARLPEPASDAIAVGDVFASSVDGKVFQYSPNGTLRRTLQASPGGEMTGSAFDKDGNLYVTAGFAGGGVVTFDSHLNPRGAFGTGYENLPESVVLDARGNVFVGAATGGGILRAWLQVGDAVIKKLSPSGQLLETYSVQREARGSDWIDLAADQKTIFYTSEGVSIKRYDIETKRQLPDFSSAGGGAKFALRVLPNGEVMVAAHRTVLRFDSAGQLLKTYLNSNDSLFALNLDPDGTSFWTAEQIHGSIYRIDIASGNILTTIPTGVRVSGLSVYGELTASMVSKPTLEATPPPLKGPETRAPDPVPFLIEPKQARAGESVRIVAGMHHDPNGPPIPGKDQPQPTTIQLRVDDQTVILTDDGLNGDDQAGDGRYSGTFIFRHAGPITVTLLSHSGSSEHQVQAVVQVAGSFVYRGGPILLDLGTLPANSEACQPVVLAAEQNGEIPFSLRLLGALPPQHRLELRTSGKTLSTGGASLLIPAEARLEVCLVTGKRAPSSEAFGEPWLRLTADGSSTQSVELRIRWRVNGLSFWQRWWWLFLLILLALLLFLVVYGYIRPYRFGPELALTFVPEYAELDETPQPLAQWRGVGIGFYRDATAYLQPNYRVSGEARGAIAVLAAKSGGSAWVSPGRGMSLFRELDVGEWQEVPLQGQGARRGAIYRVGDAGPFFRLTTHV
jgi:hypothetical protein